MPKTNTKKRQSFYRRPVFWAIFAAIIVLIMGVVIFTTHKTQVIDNSSTTSTPLEPTTVEQQTNDNVKPDATDDEEPVSKVTQYEGEDPNTLPELTGSISYKKFEHGTLTVQVMINQFLSDGGTCTLTLTGQSHGTSRTVTTSAFADISTSACETFTVTDLPSDNYKIEIRLSGDNKTGLITEEITL